MESAEGSSSQSSDRGIVLYPIYINLKKTIAEGRKLPKEKCVENPTIQECAEVLKGIKFPHQLEADKCYSRDYTQKGRVRIFLKNEDGTVFNKEIATRKAIFAHIASLIPKLNSRTASSTQASGSSKKKKKKGKK